MAGVGAEKCEPYAMGIHRLYGSWNNLSDLGLFMSDDQEHQTPQGGSMSREAIARRITREVEDAVTHNYPGEGLLGVLVPDYDLGMMFIELPYAMQWKELNERVNWNDLTAMEKNEVMTRVLTDVRENTPEEIYPATWFDGVLITGEPDAKIIDLEAIRKLFDAPDRNENLDERVCLPERMQHRTASRSQL